MRIEYETRGLIRFREMRIHFGMILSILRTRRINENMVWTDSQDYGADEILYTIGTVLFNINNRLMHEITILFEVYPRLFHVRTVGVLKRLFMIQERICILCHVRPRCMRRLHRVSCGGARVADQAFASCRSRTRPRNGRAGRRA